MAFVSDFPPSADDKNNNNNNNNDSIYKPEIILLKLNT